MVTGILLVIDQLTKAWVVANFVLYERKIPIPALQDVFNFTYTQNTGAAFGLFQGVGNFFLFAAIIASTVIIYYYRQLPTGYPLIRVAMGLMMGGALGNAIDRVTRGFVVDFLHVFYEPLGFNYPIFNIADAAIVIGVGMLTILLWGKDDLFDSEKSSEGSENEPPEEPKNTLVIPKEQE